MKSKYLEAFQKLQTEGKDLFQIIGDVILVEEATPPEVTTKSGIILTGSNSNRDGFAQNRPTLVHILAVGEGYYDDETEEDVPLNVKPGDICLTGVQSCKWLSYFGPIIGVEGSRVGLARESDIQLIFRGPDAYQKAYAILETFTRKTDEAA